MKEQTTPAPVVAMSKPGCVSQITTVLVGLLAVSALTILALTLLGIDPWGIAAARLAPTVQTRPTATPRATSLPAQPAQPAAQPAQPVQATTAPVAQPVAPAPEVVEQPAPVEVDDAPAQLEGAGTSFTRGTICFGRWYYVDGVRSNTPCSGSGGD